MRLGSGDVIVWNHTGNSPIFRTVIEGPRDDAREKPSPHITLPIRRRSWTTRSHTGYFWNDCKHIITPTGKRHNSIFTEDELERILSIGLKPKWDMLNTMETNRRTGWQCGRRAAVLAQRALQALQFANIT